MQRILIVDDDPDIQRLVSFNLQNSGFETLSTGSGWMAIEMATSEPLDLIILDLMLPDLDGMEVCRRIRERMASRSLPLVMLTARGEELDRVRGFELGADDYVTKPFSPKELVLRVKSILRRAGDIRPEAHRIGDIEIDPARRQCFAGPELVSLTPKEFDLLLELARAGGSVVERDTLMARVWGYRNNAASRTLDTHIRRLREKLGSRSRLVQTIRGVGFRIAVTPDGACE